MNIREINVKSENSITIVTTDGHVKTFKKEKTFTYEMEGWGITNDGEKLYMSDGSEKIYILNPESLKVEDFINVYTNGAKIESVNELEWINGKIWANIYQKDAIGSFNNSY